MVQIQTLLVITCNLLPMPCAQIDFLFASIYFIGVTSKLLTYEAVFAGEM